MKRRLPYAALVSFLAAASPVPSAHGQGAPGYVPRQVIIRFNASTLEADARAVREDLNAVVVGRFERIGAELWIPLI